jgi:RND family efflux transporter MFP subunit
MGPAAAAVWLLAALAPATAAGLAAGVVGLSAGPATAQGAEGPLVVRVDTVRSERIDETVPVIGRLIALESGEIAARESGAIADVPVRVGDRVAAGDVLARLDADRIEAERDLRAAEVTSAEATVRSAVAQLRLKRQELDRLERLRRSPAFSEARFVDQQQEVAIAEARLAEAEASLIRARAQLTLAEISVEDSVVRAPYAGVVTRRQADVGARVDEGDPIVSLVDDRRLEIEADVPAAVAGALEPGVEVDARFEEAGVRAVVRAVLPVENAMTRTRTVRLRSDFAGVDDLVANRSVTVLVPRGAPRAALTVHKDAVLYRSGGTFVYRLVEGKAELAKVDLGDAQGSRFEVTDGLPEGARVITRGNERLKPGQPVEAGDVGDADGAGAG